MCDGIYDGNCAAWVDILAPTVVSTLNCKLKLPAATSRIAAACRRDCGGAGAPPHLTPKIYILLGIPHSLSLGRSGRTALQVSIASLGDGVQGRREAV